MPPVPSGEFEDGQSAPRPPHWLDYLDGEVVRKAPVMPVARRVAARQECSEAFATEGPRASPAEEALASGFNLPTRSTYPR